MSPLGSWSLAATLLVDVNHPGSQEDLAGNKVYLQFGRGGPLPSGSGCRLPASLPLVGRWAGPQLANSPSAILSFLSSVSRPRCALG